MKPMLRISLRFVLLLGLIVTGLAAPARQAQAATLDTTADHVIGQPNFTSNTANNGGVSASSLNFPYGMVLDAQGNLYIADSDNNRVLEYDSPLTTDLVADRVFGQPDFTSNAANNGGVSASSLYRPTDVAVDQQGNLYIADTWNNRVLKYDSPLTTDASADRVFGQPNFTANIANNGGISASSLNTPAGLAFDSQGNLFIADLNNHRVLGYALSLGISANAVYLIGQPDFTTNTANNGGISASRLNSPAELVLDSQGNLYISDFGNHRVLEYDGPVASLMAADRVFGQPNFTSNASNNGGVSANSLSYPYGLAVDASGSLLVADSNNHRLLVYNAPLTTNSTADRVFGQPNFTSNTPNNGGLSASSLGYPLAVTLDTQGNLYTTEVGNNRALVFDIPSPYSVPTLIAISPNTVAVGSPDFTLTVTGSGFVAGSTVRWNGSDRPTNYLSSTRLTASISAADVIAGGPFAVTVFTPAPGGGTSALVNLDLYARSRLDTTADALLGQPGFLTASPNNVFMDRANRIQLPQKAAVDPNSGRLFVADSDNHRVLSWRDAASLANSQAADLVLGQPNFSSTIANHGGISAASLFSPVGVAVDGQGNLYVADSGNHRVLFYSAPLTSGMPASRVYGQGGSFTSAIDNNGGVSANSLSSPADLALDVQGNLFVADANNHRILQYNTPQTTASQVFGQPNFTSNTANNGGVSADSLDFPYAVALDSQQNLYVADFNNSRILVYDSPLESDASADHVLGQPDFTSNAANNGGVSASSLSYPQSITLDPQANLFVADSGNSRVLFYDHPRTTDSTADRVFGQPDFSSVLPNNGGISASSMGNPVGLAFDRAGLFVVDAQNHRVTIYDLPLNQLFVPLIRNSQ
jgi:sugar lactone lactonase YvrE